MEVSVRWRRTSF